MIDLRRGRCLLRLTVASLFALQAIPNAQAQEFEKLSADQRKQVYQLISDYRKSGDDFEKKKTAVEAVTEFGPQAAARMMKVVGSQLKNELEAYSRKFKKVATKAYHGKLQGVNFQHVQSLRDQVLQLRKNDNLEKSQIVAVGDPGLAELEDTLIVSAEEVLALDESLLAERSLLLELGQLWETLLNADNKNTEPDHRFQMSEYLAGEEKLAAQLSAPMDNKTRSILGGNARLAKQIETEEARAILACNLTRILLGLNPLMIDLKLCAAARDHSNDMKEHKFFSHQSPVAGKTKFSDRAKNFGTTASGENIYRGRKDGVVANQAWWHSPGHHRNMLGSHQRIGMGHVEGNFTEMFGR